MGVRLGEHDTTTNPDCLSYNDKQHCAPPSIDVEISEKIVHPNYVARDRNRYNDIALLRLDSEIPFTCNNIEILQCYLFTKNMFIL